MRRRAWLGAVFAALLLLSGPFPAGAQQPVGVQPAASETARDVLTRVRPAIIQIRGFLGSNTAQSFHGTGFAVADGGLFVTNYHVVAEHVQSPTRYRLEYRGPDGATGAVSVLAVDVRNDLALVRAAGHAPQPIRLQPVSPAKGERAFAIGFPLDVGLTITEGVSNGRVEDAFQPRIHYAGALNAGMSGGPALNAASEVIGVNVSGYRFQQLVSFLVPAEHAISLIKAAPASVPDQAQLKHQILEQLQAHSSELLGAIAHPLPTQVTSGYVLPDKLAPFIDCNASGEQAPDQVVRTVRIDCSAKSNLQLQSGMATGEFKYMHFVMTSEKIGAWRFARRLSQLTHATGARGSSRHVGTFACEDRIVALKGFDASIAVCARSYRRHEGLYDFTVRVNSVSGGQHGFASHLDMFGMGFDEGMKFIERYIAVMEYRA